MSVTVSPAAAQLTPRPVFCVIERAHRDLALAEAVCAGRFSHHGTTLDLGTAPDWLGADLPADEEWRIAWSKFYEGLDLAHAFRVTGDVRFLRTWESLVGSWIDQVPVGSDETDTAARRMESWLYAWSAFAHAPGFPGLTEGLAEALAHAVAEHAAHIRAHLTPGQRNHRTLELHALFLAAITLPELDPGGLLDFATAQLHENLLAGTFPDGVQRECSTHYHLMVLQSFLAARENGRRFGVPFPAGYDAQLERACEFALHIHRPDGDIPSLSDGDSAGAPHLLELAAALFDRPDLLYAATAGDAGVAPARRHVSFPAAGYHIQRSGWGEGATPYARERFLIFDCGPIGDGGHGHYDTLSFEAAAGGGPLIVDPGRFTYSEEPPNWRRWFKGTEAHNTVTVDRADQSDYRLGKPKNRRQEGRFLGRWTAPGLDVVAGEAVSPHYDAVHQRSILFVADEYWVIDDRLAAPTAHRYDLRFHLAAAAQGATRLEPGGVVRAPGLALVITGAGRIALEDGWVSPEYGIRFPAPVVSALVDESAYARFLSLVVPCAGDTPAPVLEIVDAGGAGGAPTVVEVHRAGGVDRLEWGAGCTPRRRRR